MYQRKPPLLEIGDLLTFSKDSLLVVRMPNSTVTSKGQITVPKIIRDALQLEAGDRVQFRLRDDGVVEMKPETGDLTDLFEVLKPSKKKQVSENEMDRAIRETGAGL
jgi:AbrB family looped-hinge helix DNA binding protein